MESIQLAQMLADISDLSAADPKAAAALVNANKTLDQNQAQQQQQPSQIDALKPPSSPNVGIWRTTLPAFSHRFDKAGRRIMTPPLTRSNSSLGSIPGTPRPFDPEDEFDRASTPMALYEIRNTLKQHDKISLLKAREKIEAMLVKQKAAEQGKQTSDASHPTEQPPGPRSRYTYPKPDTTTTPEEK